MPTPPAQPLHLTFICTGNICRSPMAALIVAEEIRRAGLADAVAVTSAGTSGWHVGSGADERARTELVAAGYPSEHRASQVGPDELEADLIVALDRGHVRALRRLGADPDRVRLLRSFDPDSAGQDVADPYYGTSADFRRVREEVQASVPGLIQWVRDNR